MLGPDLWNVMYDDLLKILLHRDVENIAFADDIALITTATVPYVLEDRLESAFTDIVKWMDETGLILAIEITEVVILTRRIIHNIMTVSYGNHRFESK